MGFYTWLTASPNLRRSERVQANPPILLSPPRYVSGGRIPQRPTDTTFLHQESFSYGWQECCVQLTVRDGGVTERRRELQSGEERVQKNVYIYRPNFAWLGVKQMADGGVPRRYLFCARSFRTEGHYHRIVTGTRRNIERENAGL